MKMSYILKFFTITVGFLSVSLEARSLTIKEKEIVNKFSKQELDFYKKNLSPILKDKKVVCLEISISSCPVCIRAEPLINELKIELKNKVTFFNKHIDDEVKNKYLEPVLKKLLNITIYGVPTFLIFKNGELIKTEVGFSDKEDISKKLSEYL